MGVITRWIVAVSTLVAGLVIVVFFANTNALAVNHGVLASDSARRDLPVVLDGVVYAHAQVGNRIFVGGEFQQVQRIDGSVVTQPNIFAYDINTGEFDENFRPAVGNTVQALASSPNEDAVYVGGRFTTWDGSFLSRIAKLSPDGTRDTNFQGAASALVRSIAVTSDTVYMAGNFTTMNGQPRVGFAAINRFSGSLDTGFVMNVQNSVLGSQTGRGIVASSDGNTVFGLHFGTHINGQLREAVTKIDVSGTTASLANWSIDWSGQAGNKSCLSDLRDIAISPDDSFIVIGGQGADNPPNCDSILRYETGGTGVISFTWTARMYSSVFSLAVSDVAVYAGGHFCAAPKNGAPAGGSTHDPNETGTANKCNINDPNDPVNPSVIFPNSAVFRSQMAALDPSNGQGLNWDPGSNNSLAVFDLELIDRGLLAGHDSDRFSTFNVGRSGFFDFGVPPDTTPPTITIDSPTNGAILGSVSSITGSAQDDRTVTQVTVRLKNLDTNEFLQANGSTFAPTTANAPVTISPAGLGQVDWSVAIGTALPAGNYQIRAWATDPEFQTTTPQLLQQFEIVGQASCTVMLNANNAPVISWSGFTSGNNVQIRRDGSWLATGASVSGSHIDTTTTPGTTYNYAVRWNPNGTNVDVPCTPNSITVPTPGGATCNGLAVTVDLGAGDSPTAGADVILGTGGADVIVALGGADTICALGGNDTINAGTGNDWVDAGTGNDTVFGLDGADTILGRSGDDTIVAGNGDDVVDGNNGDDVLNGGPGNDIINGGGDDDTIFGQGGNDTLNGNDGNDELLGVDGADTLNGGNGTDVLNAGPGNDVADGGAGNDVIFGLTGNDTLNGGGGNDSIFGQQGTDVIDGGDGNDQLLGNEDDDVITDPSGTNTLNGGEGDDTLTGGTGSDNIFGDGNLLQAGDDTINGGAGTDLLIGFAGSDVIVANDGQADTVNGGPGVDNCTTDGTDTVFNCP